MNTSSTFDLWVDYTLNSKSGGVKLKTSEDAGSLARLGDQLLSEGAITHWYIVEKRTVTTFHIHAVMGD